VHAKLSTLQRPESLSSWLYGIIRRVLSDYRRARRIKNAAEERLGAEIKAIQPAPATPLAHTEWKAELALLQRVLLALNGPNREIFILVEILEMTVPEVVQTLGIPLDTAYSRLRRARLCFDRALARYEAQAKQRSRLW
jgi:RNA polymerase sigma-70 factor, ECF subfamily